MAKARTRARPPGRRGPTGKQTGRTGSTTKSTSKSSGSGAKSTDMIDGTLQAISAFGF